MELMVYGTPDNIPAAGLAGTTAVVIDALRMTSVAITAVAAGCAGVKAVAEVDEARALAAREGALLGGERHALPIEGFDFSNSPAEYTPARVWGRRLVMSTSNGTRATLAAHTARRVLLGAFINAGAVAAVVRREARVAIVCAGTLGAFTLEDALAAGAIIARLQDMGVALRLDDMALAVHTLYGAAQGDLPAALAQTAHYGRLLGLGLQDDLAYCLAEDTAQAVPERGDDGWFA